MQFQIPKTDTMGEIQACKNLRCLHARFIRNSPFNGFDEAADCPIRQRIVGPSPGLQFGEQNLQLSTILY
ncbi:hypothetical protein D3C78_1592680 [compost metagenome]